MKYAVKTLLAIFAAVALCSCESLPFDRGDYAPSRNQAVYDAYYGFRSEVGRGDANVEKLNALYSLNW
jgi:hypothetical protein